jgi:hypothetical protein
MKLLELDGVFIKTQEQIEEENKRYNAEQKRIMKARGILNHENNWALSFPGESPDWSTLNTFVVDLFSLEIYGFLICRGSVKHKAGLLFDFMTRG